MKKVYVFSTVAIAAVGVAAFLYLSQQQTPFERYTEMRMQALEMTSEQIQLANDRGFFGIVMDRDLGDLPISIVMLRTGQTKMYTSTDFGMIDGSHYEHV